MKKGFIIIALATMLLALAGCSSYTNSYSAVGFIHSSTPKGGFMNFHTFKGRMVFNLRVKDSEAIVCSGKLEEGSLCVYYDTDGEKKELVKLDGGQTFGFTMDDLDAGKVHIIVETDGKCRDGNLEFKVQ